MSVSVSSSFHTHFLNRCNSLSSKPIASVLTRPNKMRVPFDLKQGQSRIFHQLPSGLSMEVIMQKGVAVAADAEKMELEKKRKDINNNVENENPALVFVHGSYHAAWCWAEHWLPFFSASGYDCYALSLLGQGESDAPADSVAGTLETHARDVADFINQNISSPPVLLGHSFGGLIIQYYISNLGSDKHKENLYPKLGGAVLVCSVPPSGNSGLVWRYLFSKPIAAFKVTRSLAVKAFQSSLSLCKETFFSATMEDHIVKRYQELMKESSRMSLFDLRKLNASLPVPSVSNCPLEVLVLGAKDDFIVDAEGLKETADFYGVSPVCVEAVAHDMMLDRCWEKGAEVILSWLNSLDENNHIKVVYYYHTSGERVLGEVTKKLRETLSEMLTHFPIVTGRLVRDDKGHWKIKCNDAGVRMVEATAKGSVEGWLRDVDVEKELKLVHWEAMLQKPYYWSTFYVQVTEFEEGGLAIGLSCIHLLADSTCVTKFIKAWADISLGGKMIDPPIFHPLPPLRQGNKKHNHQLYVELINHYKSSIEKPIPVKEAKYTTISLGFSDQMVQACMSMAQPTSVSSSTPFEALAGLFWVSLSKIKGLRNRLVDMSICVDVRKVLGLDNGFFGSCVIYNMVQAEGILGENNFPQAARAIRDVVAKMDNEGIMDLIEWFEDSDINSPILMNGHGVICANLEGVDPYLTEFQEGFKPIRVSCYIEPVLGEGQVLILPAPPGEGPLSRVVMVTLREEEAIKLCEDDLISQFSPTILMKC